MIRARKYRGTSLILDHSCGSDSSDDEIVKQASLDAGLDIEIDDKYIEIDEQGSEIYEPTDSDDYYEDELDEESDNSLSSMCASDKEILAQAKQNLFEYSYQYNKINVYSDSSGSEDKEEQQAKKRDKKEKKTKPLTSMSHWLHHIFVDHN